MLKKVVSKLALSTAISILLLTACNLTSDTGDAVIQLTDKSEITRTSFPTSQSTKASIPTVTNTATPTSTSTLKTYYVTVSMSARVFSCASADCGVVTRANHGDALTVVDDTGIWYELQLDNGGIGYIASSVVGANPPMTTTYYVTASGSIDIRSCASRKCEVVAMANHGDMLTVIEDSGDWYMVRLNNGGRGHIAYYNVGVNSPSMLPTTAPIQLTVTIMPQMNNTKTYYVNATGTVNIRSCASTDCGVVTTAKPSDALTVIDDSGTWYELQLDDGKTGYIADFLVSVNEPSSQPVAVPVQATAIPQTNNIQPTAQPTQEPVSVVPVQSTVPPAPAYTCDCSKTCGAMISCEEAYYQLNTCGCGKRDSDNDGVPCESICG